jgi:DNA invertase Pin-like site-specific DNA recombinase
MDHLAASGIVAYYRVSTRTQGFHGLGMDAQRSSVAAFAERNGATIVGCYEEVETARRDHLTNRPQLLRAVAHARRVGATLVIARLDRLARSVFVTSQLLNAGVEFVAVDNPYANRLSIQILAVMAEHESRMTSLRVKASVAERRARGVVFKCNHPLNPEARRKGQLAAAVANKELTRAAYEDLVPTVRTLREAGDGTRAIAVRLNEMGHRTRRNGPWTGGAIHRLLRREGLGHLKSRPVPRPPVRPEVQRLGVIEAGRLRTQRAHETYAHLLPFARKLHAAGASTGELTRRLNFVGHTTQHGKPWTIMTTIGLLRDSLGRQSNGLAEAVSHHGCKNSALKQRRC